MKPKEIIANLSNHELENLCVVMTPPYTMSFNQAVDAVLLKENLINSIDAEIPYGWKIQIIKELIGKEIQNRCAQHLL